MDEDFEMPTDCAEDFEDFEDLEMRPAFADEDDEMGDLGGDEDPVMKVDEEELGKQGADDVIMDYEMDAFGGDEGPAMKVVEDKGLGKQGIKKKLLKEGEGSETPEVGDEIEANYTGTLLDGTEFDSSYNRREPFKFKLGQGQVIKGWDPCIMTMKRREKATFTIPPELAYGESGSPPKVPPNATLQFDIELLSWTGVKDICKDGGVLKKILKEGQENPIDSDEVHVKYEARLEDGTIVSKCDQVEFTVKDGYFCPALARAVKTMKHAEKAFLRVKPQYGFGEKGRSAVGKEGAVPPNATMLIDLELVSWKTVTEIGRMGFENLHPDVVRHICGRLVCRLDRLRMAEVCKHWESAIKEDKKLIWCLPLLFFARCLPPAFSCLHCEGALHHFPVPSNVHSSKCVGSESGGWVLTGRDYSQEHNQLLNLTRGEPYAIVLPRFMQYRDGDVLYSVVIQYATFSATPTDQISEGQCAGAAVVLRDLLHSGMDFDILHYDQKLPEIMFWRLDKTIGLGSRSFELPKDDVEDLIHYNGSFLFLTGEEQIVWVDPSFDPQNPELQAEIHTLQLVMPEDCRDACARYLVESRNKVLMVRRYCPEPFVTDSFRVFELTLLETGKQPEDDSWLWTEVNDLDGRMIFLSRGCSKCYETIELHGVHGANEGIYYKGDVYTYAANWDDMGVENRRRLTTDSGRWVGPFPGLVDRCFVIAEHIGFNLNHSSPVWILPKDISY